MSFELTEESFFLFKEISVQLISILYLEHSSSLPFSFSYSTTKLKCLF